MAQIPSIEKTEDFIYRFEIKKGTPLHDPGKPNVLVTEQFIGPAGVLHSMDVTISRDRLRARDIAFRSFEHVRDSNLTYLKFTFQDDDHHVIDHNYLLTVILRYLQDE